MATIEVIDPKTGNPKKIIVTDDDLKEIQRAAENCKPTLSRDALYNFIDNLDVSVEVKALLIKLMDYTVDLAGALFSIGKKVIEFLIYFVRKYPNMALGALIGLVMSALISAIPFIGHAVAAFVGPILILLGMGIGAFQDLKDQNLRANILNATEEYFGGFKNVSPKMEPQ